MHCPGLQHRCPAACWFLSQRSGGTIAAVTVEDMLACSMTEASSLQSASQSMDFWTNRTAVTSISNINRCVYLSTDEKIDYVILPCSICTQSWASQPRTWLRSMSRGSAHSDATTSTLFLLWGRPKPARQHFAMIRRVPDKV